MNKTKLRVWHKPQVPCKAFYVNVNTFEEAKNTMEILANYDLFQFENNIRPDFCNVQGIECFDKEEQEWFEWYDEGICPRAFEDNINDKFCNKYLTCFECCKEYWGDEAES